MGSHLLNQNPCVPTGKISADCLHLGNTQSQTIPAEKAQSGFKSRFE
jgi:hypothetical protein